MVCMVTQERVEKLGMRKSIGLFDFNANIIYYIFHFDDYTCTPTPLEKISRYIIAIHNDTNCK